MRILALLNSRLAVMLLAVILALLVPGTAYGVSLAVTTTAFNAGGASDINQALKIFFNEPVIENIVQDSELLSLFEEDNNVKQDETTGGRYIETAQYFQLPAGVGARGEGEYIPVPQGPVIQNSRVNLKKIQGVLEMTGDVMRRVKGDMGAYLNWAERALPDLVKRVDHEVDRMLLGYGNGALARIAALPGGNVINLDRAFGVTGATPAFLNFMEGQQIVLSVNANGNPLRNAGAAQAALITKVDPTGNNGNGSLTVDAVQAAAAVNDYIFAGDVSGASTQDAGGNDREIMGLLGMVDDGTILATFQNIVRATYILWQSLVVDASAAPYNGVLTEDLLTYGDDEVYIKGGGRIGIVVSSRSGIRSYWKSLKGDRTINDPRGYTGGKGPVSILLGDRNVPLKAVRKMPFNFTFGLDLAGFKRWTLGGWQWDDTTGAIWNRVTDATGRKDAYYGVGNMYLQMGNLTPRHNVRFQGIANS